ncbi:isochorismate synthase MenF [Nibricoccus sp. IMCC34717]|uniref:isochorismate synthase n=1 Tax=Nibricoccus sp. IMCC34717 TaxID=3034021 RepID=UPI00384AA705
MTILPIDPAASDSREALHAFFAQCQLVARKRGRAQLVSITLPVDALDPLAVLESIFEPVERHFYLERPAEDFSVAGAESALCFTADGESRFAELQARISETWENALVVGDQGLPFSGPHFFLAAAFFNRAEREEVFPAVTAFIPRWQVARVGGRSVAVANTVIEPEGDLLPWVERVWRARGKFRAFDYSSPDFTDQRLPSRSVVAEVGSENGYVRSVSEAVAAIQSGEFAKIVLARAKDLVADQALHPLRVLNGLRERYPDCYAFSVGNTTGQSFIGATPERLMRMRAGRFETEALAGSARRGGSASEDAAVGGALLRSHKDLQEHQVVIDSIARRLKPLGLVLEALPAPRLRKLANVQHLQTALEARVPEGVAPLAILDALHPTPAVGGSPREAAVSRIRAWEPFPRGLYAGALGWLDAKGACEFVVGLRSALIDGPRARLYAGAGLVAGSVPAEEWAETELKFKAMQEALLGQ